MRLPGGPHLALHGAALAAAIAAEWQQAGGAKGGTFQAEDVPLTRLAGTAQERVAPDPGPTIEALLRYGEGDLLTYRATAPAELVRRQAEHWQPWLDWAAERYEARLRVIHGIIAEPQPPEALRALRQALAATSPFTLAGLGVLVPVTGSLILGLAVAEGALSPEQAHRLALLDELFQAEQWGEDGAALSRQRHVLEDIRTAASFIALGG